MRTAEERAQAVNEFVIYVGDVVRRSTGQGVGLKDHLIVELTLVDVTLQDLLDVIEELREAKLARAKLELKA